MTTLSTAETLYSLYGLFMLATGIGLVTDPSRFDRMVRRFPEEPSAIMLSGIVAFVIGGATLSVHTGTDSLAALTVTVFAGAALVKGVLLLAIPGPMLNVSSKILLGPLSYRVTGAIYSALGLALLLAGLG